MAYDFLESSEVLVAVGRWCQGDLRIMLTPFEMRRWGEHILSPLSVRPFVGWLVVLGLTAL